MGQPGAGRTVKSIRRAYTQISSGQVHYRHAGDPGCPVLILLHQTPSHSAMYLPLMSELAGQYHLIAPDTPGFGLSDALAQHCSIEALANSLLEFLEVLGVEQCMLFGHHTGAAVAVQMVVNDPERFSALALCGPTMLSESQRDTLPAKASSLPAQVDGSHLLAMWQRISGKDRSASLQLIQREVLSALSCGDAYQASYQAVCAQDFASQVTAITCPVLAFAGDEDLLSTAVNPTLALLRDGHTASLPPGAGTYACEQQAPEMALILRDFFNTRSKPGE